MQCYARLVGGHKASVTKLLAIGGKEPGSPDGLISAAADGTVATWLPSNAAAGKKSSESRFLLIDCIDIITVCLACKAAARPVQSSPLAADPPRCCVQGTAIHSCLQWRDSRTPKCEDLVGARPTCFGSFRTDVTHMHQLMSFVVGSLKAVTTRSTGPAGKEVSPSATAKPHDAEITSLVLCKSSPAVVQGTPSMFLMTSGRAPSVVFAVRDASCSY